MNIVGQPKMDRSTAAAFAFYVVVSVISLWAVGTFVIAVCEDAMGGVL